MATLARRLGYDDDAKLVIISCDDLGACHVGRKVGGPQTLATHLLLQRVGDLTERGAALRRSPSLGQRLQGDDLVAHELSHPLQLGLELGLCLEIPRHRVPLAVVRRSLRPNRL